MKFHPSSHFLTPWIIRWSGLILVIPFSPYFLHPIASDLCNFAPMLTFPREGNRFGSYNSSFLFIFPRVKNVGLLFPLLVYHKGSTFPKYNGPDKWEVSIDRKKKRKKRNISLFLFPNNWHIFIYSLKWLKSCSISPYNLEKRKNKPNGHESNEL